MQKNYLLIINPRLKSLNESQLESLSKQSIVKEKIKKKEIIKYFTLDQANPYLNQLIKNLSQKLGFEKEENFEQYLNKFSLTLNSVKKKIEIETTWNRLIFQRYKNQININENLISNKINNE